MQSARSTVAALALAAAQNVLKHAGIYHRLKASRVYDLYWELMDHRVVAARQAELRFYSALLDGFRPGQLIFDVGANHGAKTEVFLRMGARVVAVDPDESNARLLKEKFQMLRLRRLPITIVAKAVTDRQTTETLWIEAPGSGKNTLSTKWVKILAEDDTRFGSRLTFRHKKEVPTTTLTDLIETYGMPYFVKIDVEGLEAAVLRGLQRVVPHLSFEVNLPDFSAEGLECVKLLERLDPAGRFNFASGADAVLHLQLSQWASALDFADVLLGCNDKSIEVFWRASHR
jgi:FkbM family methyltransferase